MKLLRITLLSLGIFLISCIRQTTEFNIDLIDKSELKDYMIGNIVGSLNPNVSKLRICINNNKRMVVFVPDRARFLYHNMVLNQEITKKFNEEEYLYVCNVILSEDSNIGMSNQNPLKLKIEEAAYLVLIDLTQNEIERSLYLVTAPNRFTGLEARKSLLVLMIENMSKNNGSFISPKEKKKVFAAL
jgi:hypothetical protein